MRILKISSIVVFIILFLFISMNINVNTNPGIPLTPLEIIFDNIVTWAVLALFLTAFYYGFIRKYK